jgi:hypothetical protein
MNLHEIFSYIFNLITFGIFVIYIVANTLYNVKKGQKQIYKKSTLYKKFTIIGVLSMLTIWGYVDAPKSIFKNSDHHILEHLGFSFEKNLILVDQNNPNHAIFDDKKGDLTLGLNNDKTSFRLLANDFFEPIYLSKDGVYELINPLSQESIENQIEIKFDSIGVKLVISEGKDYPYTFYTIANKQTFGPFKVPIKTSLTKGYSLGRLLDKCQADVPGVGQLIIELDRVLLVRKRIGDENSSAFENPLFIFPDKKFIEKNIPVTIDKKSISFDKNAKINKVILPEQNFFLGLKKTNTTILKLNCKNQAQNICELTYNFPNKKYLKNLESEQESLFITSSSDEVSKSEQMAGFYYPIFERSDNIHHFSTNLSYVDGSTQDKMSFRILNYDQNDITKKNEFPIYTAGDTIRIESRGVSQEKGTSHWLFKIQDLKATNNLQFWHLLLFSLWMILCVFISIYLTEVDSKNNIDKQTKAEYIVYLIIITFMTIRSILLWRMSTFLPTDEISYSVYNKLAVGGFKYFRNGVLATTIFFVLLWVWKIWHTNIQNFVEKSTSCFKYPLNPKTLILFLLYLIPILAKLGASFVSELERFGAVFLPVMVYVLIELTLLYILHKAKKVSYKEADYLSLAKMNWFICITYLAISDAGFSIIFLLCTLFYWFIRSFSFPNFNQTSLYHLGKYSFVIPLLIISFILLFSPNILSFVFQNSTVVIRIITFSLIVLGILFLIRKGKYHFLGLTISGIFVSSIFWVFALIFFWEESYIKKKIQDKNYVQYRAEVLIKNPDEIIKDEEFKFNLGNDSKLLRAAQNQWIINYFYEKGKKGSFLLGMIPNPLNYFRILPSFQKGSPYMTQISDLVTVRYLIGEHSQWVLIQLLFLMIILIGTCIDGDTQFNFYSKIRVFLACLLFAVGFFIWLAVTNRIVFLGQDFPLLSLNSWLTLFFTFSLFLGIIILGNKANGEESSLKFELPHGFSPIKLLKYLVSVILIFSLVSGHDFSEKRFDLNQTISNLQNDFVELNQSFISFQSEENRKKYPLERMIKEFDAQLNKSEKDRLFISEFSRSAYEAYIKVLSKENNPENLIHIRRRTDGFFNFAINKLYFSVQSPDALINTWKGHIMAQEDNTTFSFLNRSTNDFKEIESNKVSGKLHEQLGLLINQSGNNNIKMVQLPIGWSNDSLPIVIISKTRGEQIQNRSDFLVKNGKDIFNSNQNDFAFVLKTNDVLQFSQAGTSKPLTIQYQHQSRNYLAKNVWINGHHQFFYPLQHRFLWSYYFANLLKNKFETNKNDYNRNVSVTLDPGLTSDVYESAERFFKNTKWKLKSDELIENDRAFNLVVLGSDGGIRALCDYKKGAKIKIDPNKMEEYSELFESQYLNADTQQERLLFGNRCLLRSDNGPASTFKPIMYSSVTSQYNFDWKSLKFGGLGNVPYKNIGEESIEVGHFGNRALKFRFDNNMNTRPHDNKEYISHSTNTYNSMIVYLGSLEVNELKQVNQYINGKTDLNTFLKIGYSDTLENNFPLFNIKENDYHIARFPKSWSNNNSLMALGLWNNFKLATTPEQMSSIEGENLQNLASDLDSINFAESRSSNKLWSFPEPSHLYIIDRINNTNAIVQLASGADPINTTPLKMAEMTAKLFSFNRALKPTVIGGVTQKYSQFKVENTWGKVENWADFIGKNLIQGMYESTLVGGTAHNLLNKTIQENSNYHFYAKTGTISGNRLTGKRDKHLSLIISKKPLNIGELSPKYIKENRFFVLYFSFYKESESSEWSYEASNTVREMIEIVIKSKSFKNYMK